MSEQEERERFNELMKRNRDTEALERARQGYCAIYGYPPDTKFCDLPTDAQSLIAQWAQREAKQ